MNLKELLKEPSKGSRLQIPLSIYTEIVEYQKAFKAKFGTRITREKVIVLMMQMSMDALKSETEELKR